MLLSGASQSVCSPHATSLLSVGGFRATLQLFGDPIGDRMVDNLTWHAWLGEQLGHLAEADFCDTLKTVSVEPSQRAIRVVSRNKWLRGHCEWHCEWHCVRGIVGGVV